jgi:lysophospholipase L1-like esterase
MPLTSSGMRTSRGSWVSRWCAVLVAVLTVAGLATPAGAAPASARPAWVGTWAVAMQRPNDGVLGPNWSVAGFANHTVRQVVRTTVGGSVLRVRLSNVYGAAPLRVAGGTIAKTGTGASVVPATLRPLTFGHQLAPVIPAGQELLSDPVALATTPLEHLTVTLYFASATGPATNHTIGSATAYRASGDHRFALSGAVFTETTESYYFLSGVDVFGPPPARRAVAAFGDSITDGAFSTVDADNRYPDELAERLVAAGKPLSVLNSGIGGNRVLESSPCFGDKPVDRFARDVLDKPGVRSVIVSEATNDLVALALPEPTPCANPYESLDVQQLIDVHRELISLAHARGIRVIGGTVIPYKNNPFGVWTEQGEAVRDALNEWILTSGEYDAVVDFDGALADPAEPDQLNPALASADLIHPNDAGYHAMAAAIDLATL